MYTHYIIYIYIYIYIHIYIYIYIYGVRGIRDGAARAGCRARRDPGRARPNKKKKKKKINIIRYIYIYTERERVCVYIYIYVYTYIYIYRERERCNNRPPERRARPSGHRPAHRSTRSRDGCERGTFFVPCHKPHWGSSSAANEALFLLFLSMP